MSIEKAVMTIVEKDGSELQRARDTNTRLNRRLGSMEHDLHSLTSQAQRHANEAAKMTAVAQRQAADANRAWQRSMASEESSTTVAAVLFLMFVATLVWAVVATVFAVT